MSEQPQSTPSQVFFLEIIWPALVVFFVLFGLPQILQFGLELHSAQITCPQPTAPAVEKPSPPASGTGPPVAGDGGDTG